MANNVFNSLKEVYDDIADGYDHIEFNYKNVWIRCGFEAYGDDYVEYYKKYFPAITKEYKYAAYFVTDENYKKNDYSFAECEENWVWFKSWEDMFNNFKFDNKSLGELIVDEDSHDFSQD